MTTQSTNINNPLSKRWRPIDENTIISIRSITAFGDNNVRRGKVVGWHLSTGLLTYEQQGDVSTDPTPTLEYYVLETKTRLKYWVPAKDIVGYIKGL